MKKIKSVKRKKRRKIQKKADNIVTQQEIDFETEILRKARSLGKISIGGLYMLVGQAVKAEEIFHQVEIDKEIINIIINSYLED